MDTFIADTCYSGHNFFEPREHFLWKLPFYSGHAKFWGKSKTRKINIFCSYLFDTFAYFSIDTSVNFVDGVFELCYDPTVSIKNVINRYLMVNTISSVHSLSSNSNTNDMFLKLKKFKCQFTPIQRNVSNHLFQKAILKNYCSCLFIMLITFFRFTNQQIITHKWIPYFFISAIAPAVRTVLKKLKKWTSRRIGIGISKGISTIFFPAAIVYRLYIYFDSNQQATLVTFTFEFWFRTFNLEINYSTYCQLCFNASLKLVSVTCVFNIHFCWQ